jgi:hypothetical protein
VGGANSNDAKISRPSLPASGSLGQCPSANFNWIGCPKGTVNNENERARKYGNQDVCVI